MVNMFELLGFLFAITDFIDPTKEIILLQQQENNIIFSEYKVSKTI